MTAETARAEARKQAYRDDPIFQAALKTYHAAKATGEADVAAMAWYGVKAAQRALMRRLDS